MKEGNILVSICCITYNHAPYIRQCLEGFIMQKTNFMFEVLIHDDASTDGTAGIIKEYEIKYPDIIKPIFQTENQYSKGIKISSTYNFPRAKGKYIALCEGDDYWTDPLKLQKQVDFLEANSDYSMCFHSVDVMNQNDLKSVVFEHLEEKEYAAHEIILKWTVPTCSVVYRSYIKDKIPQNTKFQFGDDVLFITCSIYGKLYCIRKVMGVYNRHVGGVTNKLNNTKFIIHCEALIECFPVYSDVLEKKLRNYYYSSIFHRKRIDSVFFNQIFMLNKKFGFYKVLTELFVKLCKTINHKTMQIVSLRRNLKD